MHTATKNPVYVESGRRGAQRRWGEQPRVVRLDELTTEQRRLVVALVDAAKSAPQQNAPDVSETSSEAFVEVRRASDITT